MDLWRCSLCSSSNRSRKSIHFSLYHQQKRNSNQVLFVSYLCRVVARFSQVSPFGSYLLHLFLLVLVCASLFVWMFVCDMVVELLVVSSLLMVERKVNTFSTSIHEEQRMHLLKSTDQWLRRCILCSSSYRSRKRQPFLSNNNTSI